MTDQADAFLRESDAFSWYMERDPVLRSTIVAVAWLERAPHWARLVAKVERASRAVPSFRMRLVEPPARLGTPRWVVADDFDVTWHVRRVRAPHPRTPRVVIDLARIAATTAFDPAHPLWEFTVVDGLHGGKAAFVMKLHHSLTDGIGGMRLALELFDTTAAREPLGARINAPAPESLSPLAVAQQGVVHDVARFVRILADDAAAAPSGAMAAARHPLRAAAHLAATAASVARMVAPVTDTRSPIMTRRGLARDLEMLTVDLDDLKRAASAAGGTLNDAFLAAVTGGLRRYHERHGRAPDELRVTLPISIRTEHDPVAGNRITLQRFAVPVATADPATRLHEIGFRCRAARDEPALAHTNAVAGALNLLPPNVVGGMLKHVDFLASNVPGFTFPVYLAGAEVSGYFPFGPTIGASLNITLLSYDGTCCMGVTIDRAAVPDAAVMMECLAEGFDEVLTLAGEHAPPVLPLR